jgi:hypothetical protein
MGDPTPISTPAGAVRWDLRCSGVARGLGNVEVSLTCLRPPAGVVLAAGQPFRVKVTPCPYAPLHGRQECNRVDRRHLEPNHGL